MTTLHKYLAAAALAVMPLGALAQTNGSNSPYSRYGFGLLGDGGNAFNKGMAGTAYGMRNGTELNTKNPASYAAIDSLSFLFDVGVSLQNGNFSQNGTKTNAKNTSVDYITTGFRMAPRLGMSIGLVPFSTIGYEITSTKSSLSQDGYSQIEQTNTFSGDGGLHEVYAGIGWAPIKPFSLGVNLGYLWGDIEHKSVMNVSGTTNSSTPSTRQTYSADIRTYKVDFGLQYEQRINSKNKLTLGVTYGLGHDVNRSAAFYNQRIQSGKVISGDTLNCRNAFQLPHTFGVGLTWAHNNSLRVGADYTFQKWSNVKFPDVVTLADNSLKYVTQKGFFADMHKVSVGAEYIPNPEGMRWRQRVRYRAGLSYATSYAKINGNDGPHDFLAAIGVALPIMNAYNSRSLINFSVQYEHVKPKTAGMITENYIRFSIGLTFNERWFMKWKVD